MTAALPGTGAARRAELGLRVASTLVLAPVALAATYWGYPWFEVMIAALAVAMTVEWSRMVWGPNFGRPAVTTATVCLFAIALAARGHAPMIAGVIALGLAGAVAMGLLTRNWNTTWNIGGLAYIALPCISVVWLREVPSAGFDILLWLMLTVWGTDVVAYVVGRGVGGPKLAPRVSPGKTWSGLIGGMAGAGVISVALVVWHGFGSGVAALGFLLGLAVALVSQAGDLFESSLKRRFGAKDSGRLIPGHGGVLDRLDGMLAAAPVTAVVVWLAGGDLSAWR
jgi:phosphatidate cytidylyltransferase